MKPRRRKEPPIICAYPPFISALCTGNKVKTPQYFFHLFYLFYFMEWISLFEITKAYDMVYKWFTVLKNEYYAECLSCEAYSTSGFHESNWLLLQHTVKTPRRHRKKANLKASAGKSKTYKSLSAYPCCRGGKGAGLYTTIFFCGGRQKKDFCCYP